MPRTLVVSLNYRTADMTLRSVQAALRAMQGLDAELVIVDNDSGDGSYARICRAVREEPWAQGAPIRVIASDHNGGFGAGNNIGIRARLSDGSAPDFVYILNSDAFPAPDALHALQDYMQAHPQVAFAGSYLHSGDHEGHWTAFRFPSAWSELESAAKTGPISRLLRRWIVPLGVPERNQRVDWTAGASMMMRQSVLDEIGLFDETFFLYFEETDLCLRAARAGYETHYVRDSEVVHIGSVSTGMQTWTRIPGFWLHSRWHYFTKNHGRAYALAATAMHLLGGAIWQTRRLLRRRPDTGPRHFLFDLVRHDLGAAFRPLPGRASKLPDQSGDPVVQELQTERQR